LLSEFGFISVFLPAKALNDYARSVADERSVVRSVEMASSEVTMKGNCSNHIDGGAVEAQAPATAKGRETAPNVA